MIEHPVNKIFCPNLGDEWSFLESAASALGFAAVGVAPAGAVHPVAAARLRSWISAGFHAGMDFMVRTVPQRAGTRHPGILENATAVIIAALPYGDGAVQEGIWKYVARHARGIDYHITLKQKLRQLADIVSKQFPDCQYRVFTDSAPVLERAWAVVAGIGSIGKSSAVLVPGFGPKILLGEIVCRNVPAPAPQPIQTSPFEVCMDCNVCVESCPTGAIVAPGCIDSNRCLSYWTVERRQAPIPKHTATMMTSIFGCDACTAACPRAASKRCMLDPVPFDEKTGNMDLASFIRCDEVELTKSFSRTSLCRPGWENLKRNAALVIGQAQQGNES